MSSKYEHYSDKDGDFVTSLLDSIIKNGYKSYIVNDSGVVSRLTVDKPEKIDAAMVFLGYSKRDKILVVDDENKAVALMHLAGVDERKIDDYSMIVETEAAPKIRTRPEMWSKREPHECYGILTKIFEETKLT